MAFDANDLSPHELFVVDRTRDGEVADFSPMIGADGTKPTVRAGFLRKLMLGLEAGWPVRMPGVRIKGARIDGILDLSDCSGAGGAGLPALELVACDIPDTMKLAHARFARLALTDSTFEHIVAHGLDITGTLEFGGVRPRSDGGPCTIDAYGIVVGGDIKALGARLAVNGADYALVLTNARVAGSVDLAQGFDARGGVTMANARIGGELWMSEAILSAGAADALRARGVDIGGSLNLGKAKITGSVVVADASVARNLDLRASEISKPHKKNGHTPIAEFATAIEAAGLRVGGGAFLQGANIKGEIFLADARIDGYLAFGGGRFINNKGWAIRAPNVRVGGNLTLKLEDDEAAPHGRKTVIEGGAKFDRAQIDGALSWLNLELRGLGPDNAKGAALSLADARIAGALEARNLTAGEHARIDLSGASCGALDDDLKAGWGAEKASLDLEGFAYERLEGGGKEDRAPARLKWLKRARADHFSPQPYAALARVYARAGRRGEVRRVLLEQHDLRTRHAPDGPLTWLLSSAFGLLAGYGFAPLRAVRTLALFFALGIVGVFLMDSSGALVRPDGRACNGAIEPALYALDVALPVIDLGQEARCAPGRAPRAEMFAGVEVPDTDWRVFEGAALWRWGQAIYAILGAILTALALITFSGVMKPKAED